LAKKSDLPSGANFSPNEVELAEVLEFAHAHGGNRKAVELEIQKKYYDPKPNTPAKQKPKLAYNVANGMEKYGVINNDGSLTPLGDELYKLRGNSAKLHEAFARHILVNLQGSVLLECVRDMRASGEKLDLVNIRRVLVSDWNTYTTSANKTISLMRLWLDKAGITSKTWTINEKRRKEVLGLTDPEIAALVDLTPEQRAVLKTLAEIGVTVDSSKLRRATEKAYTIFLNEKNFPKVLNPLATAGFLSFKPAGGGSAPVTPLPKLLKDVTIPLIDQYGKGLPPKLRALLTQPLAEIVKELDSPSKYTKGLALEALGVKVMRSVGLDYRETRFRPTSGGRFEVDLLFDSQRLAYSRWQIQCKNTSSVDLDDVAKEVGLVYRLLSNVIVVLTRGKIGSEARRYAVDVMLKTSLAIVLIDGDDVKQIVDDPLAIYDVLDREASFAMSVKPLEATAPPSTTAP
jgi:hypothetical protein